MTQVATLSPCKIPSLDMKIVNNIDLISLSLYTYIYIYILSILYIMLNITYILHIIQSDNSYGFFYVMYKKQFLRRATLYYFCEKIYVHIFF